MDGLNKGTLVATPDKFRGEQYFDLLNKAVIMISLSEEGRKVLREN